MNRCDWDPRHDRPAERVAIPVFGGGWRLMDEQRGCQNEASVELLVEPFLKLCDACARLPRFVRCSKRRIEKVMSTA